MNENDEIIVEQEIPHEEEVQLIEPEVDDRDAELDEMKRLLEEKNQENLMLRRAAFCADRGIPQELAQDVMNLAQLHAERENISFEDAADKLCRKLFDSAAMLCDRRITTGVRTENSRRAENDRLRRAFGLN